MKKLLYICLLLPFVAFQACKKAQSPGDNYNFDNSLPPYVAFKSTAKVNIALDADMVTPDTARFAFILRTALEQPVTVTYSISGAIVRAATTIEIPKEALTTATIIVPVPAKTTPGTAVVKLEKAVTSDGKALTLGADNNPAKQQASIVITQD